MICYGSSVKGVISDETLLNGILEGKCPTKTTVSDFLNVHHRTVNSNSKLSLVSRILQHEPLVVVTGKYSSKMYWDISDV